MFQPAASRDNYKSIISTIMLSILLVAAVAFAFANNVLGILGLLAAPFWLPLCCYYIPLNMVKILCGISFVCLLTAFSLTLTKDLLVLPKGFVFVFGLASLMLVFGSSLGLLVAYSRQKQVSPKKLQVDGAD